MKIAKFNALCSHYKDSFDIHKSTIERRNKLSMVLFVVVIIFTLQLSSTGIVTKTLCQYLDNAFKIKFNGDSSLVTTFMWLILVAATTEYFKVLIEVERQYDYIHAIEDELNKNFFNSVAFTREGKFYLNKYPMCSWWIWFLYKIFYPIAILSIIIVKMVSDLYCVSEVGFSITVNVVCFLMIFITIVLSLFKMHYKPK